MRYLACAIVLAWSIPAAAQHSFSLPSIVPALPPITPSLPAIGVVPTEWRQRIPWEKPQIPAWERRQLPPWEGGPRAPGVDDVRHRRRHGGAQVIYVPYAVAIQQEPQVIVVQQPPVTKIVEIEVPAPERRVEEPRAPEPPWEPSGDRTLYVIPGCYVGHVSPVNLKLPANCDITKMTTYVP